MIRFDYPSWHDKARARKTADGLTNAQIADLFGASTSQIKKICTPSWKQYLLMYSKSFKHRKGIALREYDVDAYEFVPAEALSPIEREREYHAKNRRVPQQAAEQEAMPKQRDFETVKKNDAESGRVGLAYKISCCKCSATAEMFSPKGFLPYEFIGKKFSQRGWIVGGAARADLCPEHANGFRTPKSDTAIPDTAGVVTFAYKQIPKPNKEESAMLDASPARVAIPNPPPIAAPAPLLDGGMGKAEKRIIFAKLNDVYEDETVGYADHWTDAMVAADLGVPVEWVVEVRDESFGPETNADLRAKSYDDLTILGERINQTILIGEKKLEQTLALDGKVADALETAEKAVDRLDELVTNLKTNDDQMKAVVGSFNEQVAEFKKMFRELVSNASV